MTLNYHVYVRVSSHCNAKLLAVWIFNSVTVSYPEASSSVTPTSTFLVVELTKQGILVHYNTILGIALQMPGSQPYA